MRVMRGLAQIEEPQPSAEFRPASYRVSELSTPGFGGPNLPRSVSSSQPQPPEMQAMLDSIHKASEKGAKRMHRYLHEHHMFWGNSIICPSNIMQLILVCSWIFQIRTGNIPDHAAKLA